MSPTFRSNVETQTNKANLEDLNCGAETPVTLDESFALQTFALAIMSSLPQPTIAVPVFFFVEHFTSLHGSRCHLALLLELCSGRLSLSFLLMHAGGVGIRACTCASGLHATSIATYFHSLRARARRGHGRRASSRARIHHSMRR